MAVPSLGKCVVLLVFVLVIYTSCCAFRIRDAIQSTGPIEQSRTSVCDGGTFGKCPGDPRAVSSSASRRKYDRVENDANRARIKSRQPPVEAEASAESAQDDDGGYVGKASAYFSTFKGVKWSRNTPEAKKVRLGRSVVKEKREVVDHSEEAVLTEEDDDDDGDEETDEDDIEEIDADSADDDDDGVEVSNADDSEESVEAVVIDADEDDDDEDEDEDTDEDEDGDEDEDEIEDVSNDNGDEDEGAEDDDSRSDDETKNDDVDDDYEKDMKAPVNKLSGKVSTRTGSTIGPKKHKEDKPDESAIKNDSEEKTRDSEKRIDRGFKVAPKSDVEGDSGIDEESDDTKSELDDTRKQSTTKLVKASGKQVDREARKKSVKKDDKEESNESIEDGETDEEEDEGEHETAPVTQPPMRKLEKVRLADKDKVQSVEVAKTLKPANVILEKPAEPEERMKKIEETKKLKTKDTEVVAKVAKAEEQKTTKPGKSETNVKAEISSKVAKDTSSKKSDKSDVKLETSHPTSDSSSSHIKKTEKSAVTKTRDDKPEINGPTKKSVKTNVEASSETKIVAKKIDGSSKVDNKHQSKPKAKKRADASISLTELNDMILRAPTFVPNFTAIEDPVCQQHGKIFLRQLRGYKLWALQMLDAGAKIPSGLLKGNINQLGDFDQCLGITARVKVDEKTVKVQGKYCLATIDLHASLADMKVPVNFMQSRGFVRGSMHDAGHFIPRFTTANWAMCIPAACSAEDARSAIESSLSHLNVSSGMRFTVDVDPEMCYVRQKGQTYSKETIGVLYFYAIIICVVLVATVRDYVVRPQGKGSYSERIIMSFSLRRTLKILTKEGRSDAGEISCVHGIRSLTTVMLYVAHKLIPTGQIPYANRISITEISNNPMSSVLRASGVYTDCFLLLSGLLTAFNMARESAKRGEIRWFCRFIARFIRLTPALLVMVFWYAYVMEHIGSGPQWNSVVVANAELCKQNSWTNLLYIQNFFPFEEMCATHTHQLALDMQLTLLAPIFVFFLTFKPIVGILLVFFLLQVSATLRYFAMTSNHLSLVIFHGITIKQLYRTANLTYALSLHRATPYIFGVGLGVLLHYTGKNFRVYRIFVILGWLLAGALGAWSLFSPWRLARRDYTYDVEEAAHYAVIAPVSSSIALCWVIFACFTDHGGVVNKFLSSYWMTLLSRISYAIYLCQFAVFFHNVGTTRYTSDVQIHRLIDPYEAAVVTLVSIVLTLFIDIPMQEVKNVIMECTDGLTIPVAEAAPEPESQEAITNEDAAVADPKEFHRDEDEEEVEVPHWDRQEDVTDGLTRIEDSAEEDEPVDEWRHRRKSNGRRRSYGRRETYKDEEEDYESEHSEWDWVKRPVSTMSAEDDGLVERGRRSRSSQRTSQSSYPEPDPRIRDSSAYAHQRESDYRYERRSLSRQPDRTLRREESPRGSTKRERSTSRAPEARTMHHETEDQLSSRQFSSRPESRGSFSSREYKQTGDSSWESRRERSPRRERSTSRVPEPRIFRPEMEDQPSGRQFFRSESRGSLPDREYDQTEPTSWETGRHERSPRPPAPMTRREQVLLLSSGSEDDPAQHRQEQQQRPPTITRRPPSEPKISDEEDWEQELRIRRRKFMERLASEERETKPQPDEGNDGWDSVKRRSSAEGKLALLKDPTGSNVMDSWTVSRGPRVSLLGSSQETEDDGSYVSHKEYRESHQATPLKEEERSEEETGTELSRRHSYTSGSQVTSLEEEEEDVANNDFVLRSGSKRTTVMDLRKLSQQEGKGPDDEERAGWRVGKGEEAVDEEQPKLATLKLFKRESIVKSQASEEDPEYLLPERPKLMEQEQDHPFKKAWQLQKSRSEEDGPAAYALKEIKPQPEGARNRKHDSKDNKDNKDNKDKEGKEDNEDNSRESTGGGQSILEIGHDDETDATTIWLSRSVDVEDSRSSSKSDNETDSSRHSSWPNDDEQFNRYKLRRRRQSEEAGIYGWELEET